MQEHNNNEKEFDISLLTQEDKEWLELALSNLWGDEELDYELPSFDENSK